MLLTKSKIYEERMIVPEICDKYFRKICLRKSGFCFSTVGFFEAVFIKHRKLCQYFSTKGQIAFSACLVHVSNMPESIDIILLWHKVGSSVLYTRHINRNTYQFFISKLNL